MTVGLEAYLVLGAALFAIGMYGAVSQQGAVPVLMSLEVMAMAVDINLVAFSRFVTPVEMTGQFFTVFAMVVSAAEIGMGLALVVAIYKSMRSAELDDLNQLKG